MRWEPRNWRGSEVREDKGGDGGPTSERGLWVVGCEQMGEVCSAEWEAGMGRRSEKPAGVLRVRVTSPCYRVAVSRCFLDKTVWHTQVILPTTL